MVFTNFREDIQAIFAKDPAARSTVEVLVCYPGLHALWFHRRAHWLWTHGAKFWGRFVSHLSRFLTGIEIHPGAVLGRRVVIDHGMGVVIGETAEVGNDVLIYMGVVLGGSALENVKRHPTVEDGVIVGSGAIVLGPIRIGAGAKVGAGSVVVRSVPPGATVVGVPGRIAGPECGPGEEKTDEMPDPMLRVVSRLLDRQNQLEERLRSMERSGSSAMGEDERLELTREDEVRDALRTVIDPEVGIDVVDLGLIREIHVDPKSGAATVDLVLTTKGCPLVDYLTEQVRRRAASLPGITAVEVRVLDEPWDWERFVTQRGALQEI